MALRNIAKFMQKSNFDKLDAQEPIGIFDSGLGGLMVMQEVVSVLPNERYIYVGDEENFPYGEKPIKMLQERCINICNWLVKQGVKAIVIACNTATAAALEILQEKLPIPVMGVVRAGVMSALESTKNKSIGILATKATINMEVYQKLLLKEDDSLEIVAVPAPNLVEYVQNSLNEILYNPNKKMLEDINFYTKDFKTKNCDTVVLGCTHFPALTPVLQKELGNNVNLVSPSNKTALELAGFLKDNNLLSNSISSYKFYTTGSSVEGLKKFWAKEGNFDTLCVL